MSDSINLVTAQTRENEKRKKRTYVLRVISLVFLSSVGLISVILFILNIRISVSPIKKEQTTIIQAISARGDKLAKYNLLNNRLKGIDGILKRRKSYAKALDTLISQIPQGAQASALTIEKSDVTFTVKSSSLLPINKFLKNVVELSSKKEIIRDMIIESLSIDTKTGVYSLSIKAKL